VSNVFVIINEWASSVDSSTGSAIVDSMCFTSEEAAWRHLRDIAHAYEDDLDYDATSFSIENPNSAIEYDEYYIQELTKSGN
jgi:hypothetical protein